MFVADMTLAARHRHILWDWNGTLLDDLDLCIDVVNPMLLRHGLPAVDRERYLEIFDFPIVSFYERLGFQLQGGAFSALSHEFVSTYDARRLECALQRGAADVLRRIAASGRAQSILSAHRESTLRGIVAHHEIDAHFTELAGLPDTHAHSKVERGHELIAKLAQPPHSLLLVGDTLHDLEVADALGIDCILVAHGHQSGQRLRLRGAHVVDDFDALLTTLAAEAP